MNDPVVDAEIQRIKERIISFAELALSKAPSYLMSRLGTELGDDLRSLRLASGQKLTEFIRENLADKYRVVPVEGLPNITALVRADTQEEYTERVENSPRNAPRFHYRFWAAFSVPAKSTPRYLDPTDFVFKDLALGEDPPIGWLEVEKEFIAAPSIPNRDAEIKENIERWLKKFQLEKASFLQGSIKPSPRESGKSLLLAVLESLDRRQLQSTTLSLDVVASLLSKRI